ncbi:Hypothetical predicted protein [Mytilus galloprovincialis]|uniref:EGF-like calcium-binding domain-containing protein n=1 Tax=Mytilus galloprovincialis TaxID=29158 RepID=A0A8B6ESN6_MYTGA|nr:Hypothetical predicted protein [Mytilus galloprovincialis]
MGSYDCNCHQGYQLERNGFTCTDVNECLLHNGTCDDECINTNGSFYCKCNGDSMALSEDGVTCIESKSTSDRYQSTHKENRRTSTRTERQRTLVVQTEVVYENESNNLSRNQTVNDTIDHMHYQSLNQNPIDSNYDILHNAEVDVTSDRQSQLVINENAEQRQMEADYQEIDDVSI